MAEDIKFTEVGTHNDSRTFVTLYSGRRAYIGPEGALVNRAIDADNAVAGRGTSTYIS